MTGAGGNAGAYLLTTWADTTYSATVPVFESRPGAADALFMDFDGYQSKGDLWNGGNPYTIPAWDMDGNPNLWTPGEAWAVGAIFRIAAEDYSPFDINVTTWPRKRSSTWRRRSMFTSRIETSAPSPTAVLAAL